MEKFCTEAKAYGFGSVVVNSSNGRLVKELLKGTSVKTCCTMAYPLGSMTTATKVFEAKECRELGADEIDIVINVGRFLDLSLIHICLPVSFMNTERISMSYLQPFIWIPCFHSFW